MLATHAQIAEEWEPVNTQADAYLAGVRQQLAAGGIPATAEKLVSNDGGAAILETAARVDADLIALASRAPQGLVRALFGSVGDRLIRSAPCPVLVMQASS